MKLLKSTMALAALVLSVGFFSVYCELFTLDPPKILVKLCQEFSERFLPSPSSPHFSTQISLFQSSSSSCKSNQTWHIPVGRESAAISDH